MVDGIVAVDRSCSFCLTIRGMLCSDRISTCVCVPLCARISEDYLLASVHPSVYTSIGRHVWDVSGLGTGRRPQRPGALLNGSGTPTSCSSNTQGWCELWPSRA